DHGAMPSRTRSHARLLIDWVCIAVAIVGGACISLIESAHRSFSLADAAIQNPFHGDTVPMWIVYTLAYVLPIAHIVVASKLWLVELHESLIGFGLASALTVLFTNALKLVGRLRPDFLATCVPDPSVVEAMRRNSTVLTDVVGWNICTQPDLKALSNGGKSFPSGHSSYMFVGMTYLALHLARELHTRGGSNVLRLFCVIVLPLFCAMLVAVSRVIDYRHHWSDALVGSLLGMASAYIGYRFYYPALSSSRYDSSFHAQQLLLGH
ncbi:PAP2-domain-containing protein, partial [Ramicandelaber brevisporus]